MDTKCCRCGKPATLMVQGSGQDLNDNRIGPKAALCDGCFGQSSRFVNWVYVEDITGDPTRTKQNRDDFSVDGFIADPDQYVLEHPNWREERISPDEAPCEISNHHR